MKFEIVSDTNLTTLHSKINRFLANKRLIDVKITTSQISSETKYDYNPYAPSTVRNTNSTYTNMYIATILYNDEK
jgi:hypothetical protein